MTAPSRTAAAPLAGLRIVVPRGGPAGERAAAGITARGGIPVVVPLIEAMPPGDPAPMRTALAAWHAGEYDWLVVTSAAGAAALGDAGATAVPGRGIAAVGPVTAAALSTRGLPPALSPAHAFTGAALAAALVAELSAVEHREGARVLLAVAAGAGDDIERALLAAGHDIDRVTAYRTVATAGDPAAERDAADAAAILVTSGSVAREVASRIAPIPATTLLVAIGPPTASALATELRPADIVASRHTVSGMLEALAAHLAAQPSTPVSPTHRTTGDPA